MKRVLATTSVLAVSIALAGPGWAIADQDNSAISQKMAQEQTQRQVSNNHNTSQGGAGGKGGAGGNASTGPVTVSVVNQQPTGGAGAGAGASPTSDPSGGHHGWHGGNAGYQGGGNTTVTAPPALANGLSPAAGASAYSCSMKGFGAGGVGPTAGGLLNYTWPDEHCTNTTDAVILIQTGNVLAGLYVLSQDNALVSKALQYQAAHQPAPPQTPAAPISDPNFLGLFCAGNPQACDNE